ncbi:MAG TPA: hypothetical protein VN791_08295 [Acidimicrobiales bacterium]|nr:hypothetical protein [Acidimicrobiales bacterium]
MPGSSSFSSSARQQARDILAKPPYRTTPSHPPRPLAGVFHAIGRALNAALGGPARWVYRHLLVHVGHGFRSAFGGWWVVVLGVMAVALGVAVGVLIARRRVRVSARGSTARSTEGGTEDPHEIERRAEMAESSGDHETAVRLRFRAGLLRLQRRGVIVNQDAQTDRQLSVTLHSPTFDALAGRHEMIVYAGDRATSVDAATARAAWPRVLEEFRSGDAEDVPVGSP